MKEVILQIGFSPKGSSFSTEFYSGAARVELYFKRGRKKGFLNFDFFKNIFKNRTMSNFGKLSEGNVDSCKIKTVENRIMKLDEYQLKEYQEFKDKQLMIEKINSHSFFDVLFKLHVEFLKEYLSRDI